MTEGLLVHDVHDIRRHRSYAGECGCFFGHDTCLRPSATRNIRRLAFGVPPTTRHGTVIEPHRIAELIELLLRELACITDSEVMKRQARERDALQLVDSIAERLEHAVHLVMLAFVDRHGDPTVLALRRQQLHFGWLRDEAVLELDALAQDLEVILRDGRVHLRVIGLRDVAVRRE